MSTDDTARQALQAERDELARLLKKRQDVAGFSANCAALSDRIAGLDAAIAVYDAADQPPASNGEDTLNGGQGDNGGAE